MKPWGILLLASFALPAWADDATKKIVDCMRANVPPQLSIGLVELTVYDRVGGSRQMKGRMFTRKDSGGNGGLMTASMRIDSPQEFKGAAYLVRETEDYLRDGMFVYLPSVKRVRRVTGSFADASLLGTNFSYFDFKQLQNAFGDLSATVESVEHVNGRPTSVLSFKALPGAETRYSGVKAWIDQQACVGVRAEFYEGKKLVKELTSPGGSLKQAGAVWYVSEIEMRDPGAGTRTVLRLGGLDAAKAPPPRYFDPNAFFMGP
jgi:hypothetical protein